MILKLLLIIGVIGAVYFIFFKKKPLKKKMSKKDKKEASDMIECPICGVYSEIDDSILSNGKYYCSSECVDKA